jgi:hypothetical protein
VGSKVEVPIKVNDTVLLPEYGGTNLKRCVSLARWPPLTRADAPLCRCSEGSNKEELALFRSEDILAVLKEN